MKRKHVILKMTQEQTEALQALYVDSFGWHSLADNKPHGMLVGQPDPNSGKIIFASFSLFEAKIIAFVVALLTVLHGYQFLGKDLQNAHGTFDLSSNDRNHPTGEWK
jgi:hypothetical protein